MDQRFLTELYFQHGHEDFNATRATELINERRAASARAYAAGLGWEEDQVQQLVEESQLTPQTVRKDLRDLLDRVRTAADLGGAGLLDAQMARYQARLEMIDRQLEQVEKDEGALLEDIRRSRTSSWQRVQGKLQTDVDGNVTNQEPSMMLSHTDDGAGDARLWTAYLKCHQKREQLLEREQRIMRDQRVLMLGRSWLGRQNGDDVDVATFAEALTKAGSADLARQVVMRRLAEEVDRLPYHFDGSMPADVARAHQAAMRSHTVRLNAIRGVLAATSASARSELAPGDEHHVIELTVRRPQDGAI
jgi:hypothetical protein